MGKIWDFLISVSVHLNVLKLILKSPRFVAEPKCNETDLKKSHICPIWGQSDPTSIANLPSLVVKDVSVAMTGCLVTLGL